MAIPKLKVTKRGARELSGPGEVIITKVGFGQNYENDMDRASISGVTSIASFQPTVTQEGDYQIIDVTFDNKNTGKNQFANTFIKTIAIIAKKGADGEEFILYGGSDSQGVHVQPTGFNDPQQLLQFVFKVRLSGDANITVQASELPGLATADSVNRVSEMLGKLKSESTEELAKALNVTGVADLMGTLVTEAPLDLDILTTPGMYLFTDKHKATTKGINSNFGFLIVASNKKGAPGTTGHFTWQVFITTAGNAFIRYRINTNQWMVSAIANGTYFTSLLSRLGLDEWAASIKIKECPSGSDLGAFISNRDIPVGLNIIRDHNAPSKDVFVWKINGTIARLFSPGPNGSFLVNSIDNGRFGEWRDLSQPLAPLVSTGQFAAYLRSNAVPVGSVPVKDSTTGAFGTVTKIDNNNIFFTGAMRKQGKTYQVAFAIVDGIVPSAFTEWALT
ncbi:pyocin knob domain-containing protein [Abiotrophia defectiva]